MDKEEFDRILIEEGILSKKMRDELWETNPEVVPSEEGVRRAAKELLQKHPKMCEKDLS